jgi:hypothetical protein
MTDRAVVPGDTVASNDVLIITGCAITLPRGSAGCVVEVDEDGDLLILFDRFPNAIGVFADDLDRHQPRH